MSEYKKKGSFPVPAKSRALAKIGNEAEDSPIFLSALKGALWGLGAAIASGILLVTLMTAIAYANPDPATLISPLALLALMPAMFAGGFVTSKKVGSSPLLCGILCGAAVTLVTLLLSVVLWGLPSSGYAFWQSVALHVAAVGFSVLGAFAGNIKRKQKIGKRRFGRR